MVVAASMGKVELGSEHQGEEEEEDYGCDIFKSVIPKGPSFHRFFDSEVTTFDEFIADEVEVKQSLYLMDFETPTPIQMHSMGAVSSGRDVVGIAETGCGKTAAYLIPIIKRLLRDRQAGIVPVNRQVMAIVVVPTRELAIQVQREALKFSFGTSLRVRIVYGGLTRSNQRANLRGGADLLVATSGRLCDFVMDGSVDPRPLKVFTVDEADHCVHKGFMGEVEQVLSAKMNLSQVQVLMYSATFPDFLQRQVNTFLHPDFIFIQIGKVGNANRDIEQKFVRVEPGDSSRKSKHALLVDIVKADLARFEQIYAANPGMKERKRILIFTESRESANDIAIILLDEAKVGVAALTGVRPIHSHEAQDDREKVIDNFATGNVPVLVATDIVARGIDVPGIDHVIQYELPRKRRGDSVESAMAQYIQRMGRTGRVGNPGRATAFVDRIDRPIIPSLIKVAEDAGQEVPEWLHEMARSSDPF